MMPEVSQPDPSPYKQRLRARACGNKLRYGSGREAKKVAFFMRPKHGKMRKYRCQFCGHWHIGH